MYHTEHCNLLRHQPLQPHHPHLVYLRLRWLTRRLPIYASLLAPPLPRERTVWTGQLCLSSTTTSIAATPLTCLHSHLSPLTLLLIHNCLPACLLLLAPLLPRNRSRARPISPAPVHPGTQALSVLVSLLVPLLLHPCTTPVHALAHMLPLAPPLPRNHLLSCLLLLAPPLPRNCMHAHLLPLLSLLLPQQMSSSGVITYFDAATQGDALSVLARILM
mmetsp:Transcript_53966/g.89577  ORF Transcript_53966/g.89577 Transcript_53966/m.89577 type:complete len:218 (-) Transcript_53966:109-762(-)